MVARVDSRRAGARWTEDYSLLVLRDPAEAADRQFLAVLLERNVVGQGGSIAEALQDAQDQLVCDYELQLSENLPRPKSDPDPLLLVCYRDPNLRVTPDGEEIMLRLKARMSVSFGRLGGRKPAKPKPPAPTFEFASQAVG
jgi:hypothetical protein